MSANTNTNSESNTKSNMAESLSAEENLNPFALGHDEVFEEPSAPAIQQTQTTAVVNRNDVIVDVIAAPSSPQVTAVPAILHQDVMEKPSPPMENVSNLERSYALSSSEPPSSPATSLEPPSPSAPSPFPSVEPKTSGYIAPANLLDFPDLLANHNSNTNSPSANQPNTYYNEDYAINTAHLVASLEHDNSPSASAPPLSPPHPNETILQFVERNDNEDALDLPEGITMRDVIEDRQVRNSVIASINQNWMNLEENEKYRRMRDFQTAQERRREKHGQVRPWGVMGMYDHLNAIRLDMEWAEDAAYRRDNRLPYFSWNDYDDICDYGFNRPYFTYLVLITCTTALIWSIQKNGWRFESLSINPMIGPSTETLVAMGAKLTTLIVDEGQWYRLISPMILHAGLIHFFLNMIAMWYIGRALERAHGSFKTAIVFVISAIGGNILSAIFLPRHVTVGASGGIFGLLGGSILDIFKNWSLIFSKEMNAGYRGSILCNNLKIVLLLLIDIIVNAAVGFTPLVDNFTHLGGMIYGFLIGLTLFRKILVIFKDEEGYCGRLKRVFIQFFGLIVTVALLMVTIATLAQSDAETIPCNSCRYFSCVPFPPWQPADQRWWNCDDCDQVSADAIKDVGNSVFTELTLVCPDEQVVEEDISEDKIGDVDDLAAKLPSYCREFCENVFA